MTFSVYDEDVTSSDFVGSAVIKLSAMCVGTGIDEWYQMQHQGKNCGSVHIRSHWTPHGQTAKAAQPHVNVVISQQPTAHVQQQPMTGYGMQPTAKIYVQQPASYSGPPISYGIAAQAQPVYTQPQMGYQQPGYAQPM